MAESKFENGVIVVGAGFLGKQVVKQLSSVCPKIIHTHQRWSDSRIGCEKFDFFKEDISEILKRYDIGTVILTAKVEFHPNQHLLWDCIERFVNGCGKRRLIYLSSDGIFNGRKGLYTENQKPHPITKYGISLALCEKVVNELSTKYCIIRSSYIYGRSEGQLDS